jgi:uncharacterized protein (DUF697 family)/predicted GTPase
MRMFRRVRSWFSSAKRDELVREGLESLRQRLPVPIFWLLGKTQSGKTSIIKYLTGADQAEVGRGFRPCTHFSRQYEFPTTEAPLLIFLDTRGLEDPAYDPAEDRERFGRQAHVVVVTVKLLDHAQENLLKHLRTIRRAQPERPVVLVLTCLHEAYPQQQHPLPYPFDNEPTLPLDVRRSFDEQRRRFEGLVDKVVAVDLTPREEGFNDPEYGGATLRQTLIDVLPAAFRQTLLTLDEARRELGDIFSRQALPHIVGYSTLAATAGALPVPVVDLVLLAGIQTRMIYHLARLYHQPMDARRFLGIAGTLGLGIFMRQGTRMLIKFVPFLSGVLGSVAAGALAGASTFALGKAFCYYCQAVHNGHVPPPQDLRRYYQEQLAMAEKAWFVRPAPTVARDPA